MVAGSRIVLHGAAALGAAGIVWGAQLQTERLFLRPDEPISGQVAGYVVALTGLLVALAVLVALLALARERLRALPRALVGAAAAYVFVLVLQGAIINRQAFEIGPRDRSAIVLVNPFLQNGPGFGTALTPLVSLLVAAALALGVLAVRRRMHVHGRLVAGTALAAPMLLVAAIGLVQLTLSLQDPELLAARGTGPDGGLGAYYVVLPLAALVCIGLVVTLLVRVMRWHAYCTDVHLAGPVEETWRSLLRTEAVLFALLAMTALMGAFLPRVEPDGLVLSGNLGFGLRAHNALLLLATIAYVPVLQAHREGRRALAVTEQAAAILAALLAFTTDGALWPWVGATAPLALVAARSTSRLAPVPLLLLGFYLWAIGNTIVAGFDLPEGSLTYATSPALLAFHRVLGAAVVGAAVALVARLHSRWNLCLVAGTSAGLILLLEMSLSVWVITSEKGEALGVGSLVASQDTSVNILMHLLCFAAAAGLAETAYRVRP